MATIDELLDKAKKEVLAKKIASVSNDESLYELAKQMSNMNTMNFFQFKQLALNAPDNLKKYFNAKYFITPTNDDNIIDCEDFLR